jgi:hypothetical protein
MVLSKKILINENLFNYNKYPSEFINDFYYDKNLHFNIFELLLTDKFLNKRDNLLMTISLLENLSLIPEIRQSAIKLLNKCKLYLRNKITEKQLLKYCEYAFHSAYYVNLIWVCDWDYQKKYLTFNLLDKLKEIFIKKEKNEKRRFIN